jgi:hypothetical protein
MERLISIAQACRGEDPQMWTSAGRKWTGEAMCPCTGGLGRLDRRVCHRSVGGRVSRYQAVNAERTCLSPMQTPEGVAAARSRLCGRSGCCATRWTRKGVAVYPSTETVSSAEADRGAARSN